MTKKDAFQLTKKVWYDSIVKQLSEDGIDEPDEKIIKKQMKMICSLQDIRLDICLV